MSFNPFGYHPWTYQSLPRGGTTYSWPDGSSPFGVFVLPGADMYTRSQPINRGGGSFGGWNFKGADFWEPEGELNFYHPEMAPYGNKHMSFRSPYTPDGRAWW